jgi:predicted Zn-dependent protease
MIIFQKNNRKTGIKCRQVISKQMNYSTKILPARLPAWFRCGVILLFLTLVIKPMAYASFTVGEEKKTGEKIQSTIRQEFNLLDDPDIDQYISRLGREILDVAGPQYFDYRFFVISDKDFNAFAAPSGLIFINSGLIEAMDNEDELVGVMAHEIGHVVRRHLADRIDKGGKVSMGTAALLLAGIALGGGDLSEAVIAGALATGASMNLKFSRENEEEADRQAYRWMLQLDRDPESLVSMLAKMRRIAILKVGNPPPYLLTHPAPDQRQGYVQDLLQSSPPPQELVSHRDDFHFNRIRYRTLISTRDTTSLLPRLLKKAETDTEEGWLARLGLALLYQQDGNFAKSRQYFTELIAHYPSQPVLKADLGVTCFREGKTAEAIKLLEEAHTADSGDAYTMFHLARVLDETGQNDQALELYQSMLAITPTFARLHFYLGRVLAENGQVGQSHYYNGMFSWLEGNISTARFHLQKALENLPAKDPLREKSRNLLEKMKQLEKI